MSEVQGPQGGQVTDFTDAYQVSNLAKRLTRFSSGHSLGSSTENSPLWSVEVNELWLLMVIEFM